ncbi:MAG: hypothetical protein JWP74_2484 [Marmoricola sp.]|nr:hypothetical protein [Marmoricola sp.]
MALGLGLGIMFIVLGIIDLVAVSHLKAPPGPLG